MSRHFACAPKKNIPVEMTLDRARALSAEFKAAAGPRIDAAHWQRDQIPPEAPPVLVDAVSLGIPGDGKGKPFVRHVIVKDLHKIASRMQSRIPREGIFKNKAPIGLYALFDGQSCAGSPGAMAAEFCARNFHTQLLERLAALPDAAEAKTVKHALELVFKNLDEVMLKNQPEILDGCGAAVVLLIGEHVFSSLIGQCTAVLCQVEGSASKAWSFDHVSKGVHAADLRYLKQAAPNTVVEDASGIGIQHPNGTGVSRVSRSLGDRAWKQNPDVVVPLVFCTPEVSTIPLSGLTHPFVLLGSSPVLAVTSPQEMVDIAQEFPLQPRAGCGEIAERALKATMAAMGQKAQCTVVEICFLPPDQRPAPKEVASSALQPPAAKKPKLAGSAAGKSSMRLRHILLSHSEMPAPAQTGKASSKGKAVKVDRTRQDTEILLRKAITDLRKEMLTIKKAKDANEIVAKTTKVFGDLCREYSECPTAKKGGHMCGEIGWMTPEERGLYGAGFKDVVDVLLPGQLSDIAVSNLGLHLVQRMA